MIYKTFAATAVAIAIMAAATEAADSAYSGCKRAECMRHVIQPHKKRFLLPVGTCESARGTWSLRAGLRAISPNGLYRGRYQFDMGSWRAAGGKGDPADASWLQQAYRAVIWKGMAGIGAWPICGRLAW